MTGVKFAIGAVLLLCAGCSGASVSTRSVVPVQAFIYTDSVNVIMSEGSLCVGERLGRTVEWTGTLSGCEAQFAYQARHSAGALPPRRVLQKSATKPDQGAVVTVTDAKGKQHIFN